MTTAAPVLRPVLGTFQLLGIAVGPVGGYVAGAATLVEFVFAPPAIEADRAALDRINTYATLPEYYIDRPFMCRCCGKREIWRARVRRADDRSTEVRRA